MGQERQLCKLGEHCTYLSCCAMVLMDSLVILGLLSTLSSITSACLCSCASLACSIFLHVNNQQELSDMAKLPAVEIFYMALQPGLCMPVQVRQLGLLLCRHVEGAILA